MLRVFTSALLLGLLTQVVLCQDTNLREVKQAFDDANIPEDIDLPFDPMFLLEVSFPQTLGPAIVLKAGVQLPRNATVGPPLFAISGYGIRDGPFVIATVDPDAPTPQNPTNAQIRHFLGGNFEPSRRSPGRAVLTNTTAAISDWRQPTPPAGSDAHRYIFLVFNQPQGFNDQTLVNATTPVALFNISAFGEAVGLGSPIAGTFMLVAPDPA
ncbi:PEBP-like protein [Guyanagaster necrorhizus]|uniref:PEBP-like protein n=1 Tax=Guyanagaster necrorhizus TaxID=856835 RepID=A0A9P8AQ90_9AGAR|nr:PEBP-like protein [Guyanagaster necrorhizus MCA 3950]KAG7444123.1 PEBP-like protein [Guyanagaster necrorhizus MCA 3950]